MKKLLLQIAFLLIMAPAFSSGQLYISGTVTDSATGNPIANHLVYIQSDSSFGFYYYHAVYTNTSGLYGDTVNVTSGNTGTIYIRIYDCNNIMHQNTWNYTVGQSHTADFAICTGTSGSSPAVTTGAVSSVTQAGATLHGTVNPHGSATTVTFEYGTTTAYGGVLSAGTYSGNTLQNVTSPLNGLATGTLYHYRIKGVNSYGTSYGTDSVFTTLSNQPPTAITESATGVTNSSATIHGMYNANGNSGSAVLEWGLSPYYGSWSSGPISGNSNYPMQVGLLGLPPNTTYHYRAYVIYSGGTVYGNDSTFTTLGSSSCQSAFTHYSDSLNPLTVHFVDQSTTGTGMITQWQWVFGDGTYQTINYPSSPNVTHTYAASNTPYVARLTIHGSDSNCYSVSWDTINTGMAGCQAAYTYYTDSLNSNTVHFIDQSTTNPGTITTWTWDFGDGNVQTITFPGNPNVTHTYAGPALTHNVCLTIHGSDSTCYDVVCHAVISGSSTGCIANFAYSAPVNISTPVQFTDLSQTGGAGPITSWFWNFGDPASGANNTSTAQNPVHQFAFAGNYSVCLTIQGPDSLCNDILCKTVTVTDSVDCQAHFTHIDTLPAGYGVQFIDQSTGNPSTWYWNFGDGGTSTTQNPLHVYSAAGTYTACLTITGNNCTSTYCDNIVVPSGSYHQVYGQVFEGAFPLQSGMVMIFSLDTTNTYQPYVDVYSIDSNGVYYFTQVPDGNYYILAVPFDSNSYLPTYFGNTITWQQATLISLGTPNNPYNINLVSASYLAPGPGSASGQINTGDVASTLMDKINMILKNDQGQPVGFTGVSAAGAFDFSSLAYGTYYLYAEMPGVTSENVMIVLSAEKPHADVTLTFTGNKILGIHEANSFAECWSVYPNPVGDNFTVSIDMKQAVAGTIGLYNFAGQLVYNSHASLNPGTNLMSISTASLPAGIYTLRLYSPEGLNLSTRLIKTK